MFHLGFLSRGGGGGGGGGGANATIPELRGGKDYSIFFHPQRMILCSLTSLY